MVPDLRGIAWLAMFGFFVGIPLAVWKVIDVVLWLLKHVRIEWAS